MSSTSSSPRRWFFDAWSRFYDLEPVQRAIYRPVHQVVLDVLVSRSPPSVLDVGCGTGILTTRLHAALRDSLVCGCDFSLGMLHQALARGRAAGLLEWIQADATRLPVRTSSLGAVVSTEAFHWFPDPATALSEFHRVLIPGGTLVLGLVNPRTRAAGRLFDAGFRAAGQPAHWPTGQELEARLGAAGFSITDRRRVWRPSGLMLPAVVTVASA
jgi:ubiquinone/menaquinone biosynthesis C-methylase UbiE